MKFNQTFAILFWIVRKKITKQGLVPIYVRVTIDGQRTELSSRRFIEPEHWDSVTERVLDSFPDASTINNYLYQVRMEIIKHYNILLSTNGVE